MNFRKPKGGGHSRWRKKKQGKNDAKAVFIYEIFKKNNSKFKRTFLKEKL